MADTIEPNYANIVQRIHDILKSNYEFNHEIKEFRFGELGNNPITADRYPLCYVTIATNPEVSRDDISVSPTIDELPVQLRVLEFWIIIVAGNLATPEKTQRKLYELTSKVQEIMRKNIRLKDLDGTDPLCQSMQIYTQRRFEQHKGSLLEAMTIRIRTKVIA